VCFCTREGEACLGVGKGACCAWWGGARAARAKATGTLMVKLEVDFATKRVDMVGFVRDGVPRVVRRGTVGRLETADRLCFFLVRSAQRRCVLCGRGGVWKSTRVSLRLVLVAGISVPDLSSLRVT